MKFQFPPKTQGIYRLLTLIIQRKLKPHLILWGIAWSVNGLRDERITLFTPNYSPS